MGLTSALLGVAAVISGTILETGVSPDVLYLPAIATMLVAVALAILSWGGWQLFRVLTT